MRKYHKSQCLMLIDSIIEVQDEFVKQIEKKNITEAAVLIGDCQQAAVSVGTMIETFEGEGTEAVRFLEEYCDILFQIYEQIHTEEAVNPRKMQKLLMKKLQQAANSIWNDIRTEYEVVFLPYKASMWDSLESVWKAADADPDCTAYVVPIPYYDRKSDGSLGEMHYEGSLYPKDVPVVWYENYNFEERRPDMIYIHNPYDGNNLVTSVHPFFYSENLKNFTEKLVYIPYFVLSEISPHNKLAIENMEHFCTVPAVVHADQVIVQSEDMRQIYIDVLVKHTGEDTRAYWENKILGLGSPKFDKVAQIEEVALNIPAEWNSVLQKPDGSRKKVILYNTGLTALLKKNEQMLIKIKDTLQIFKENQEEVALLWRPHPLIITTLESMRPQLLRAYLAIVEWYKREGWGIYDDTADLNRAIEISDAYYGDPSSLVQLYEKTGKPIMMQNVDVLNEQE